MSFFLVLSQVGFLKHGYLSKLHEFFDVHTIKSKKIHVEYAGSGKYVGVFDVTPKTPLNDIIPENHLAFRGHNGLQIHDLSSLPDQDTITIRKIVFQGRLDFTLDYTEHAADTADILELVWNPSGMLLAGGLENQTIHIWEVDTWKLHAKLAAPPLSTLSTELYVWDPCIAWNPSNALLIGGSTTNTLNLWCTNTWTCIWIVGEVVDKYLYTRCVAWIGPERFAVGYSDKTIRIWETRTRTCISTLTNHTKEEEAIVLVWNSKYALLASGSDNYQIKIWDTQTWQCKATLTGHTDDLYGLAWNPSQTLLASGSYDKTIKIWIGCSWTCTVTLRYASRITSIAWNPHGTLLASGSSDYTICIWDVQTWTSKKVLVGYSAWSSSISWSRTGMLACGYDNGLVQIWK